MPRPIPPGHHAIPGASVAHGQPSDGSVPRRAVLATLAAGALQAGRPAWAQQFPVRPVRVVTPFPAGSVTDQIARPVADRLGALWKQPVIVDNRAGAGGAIGVQAVATSPADGYTLLIGSNGTHGILPALASHLPYDPVKGFEPVTQLVSSPLLLVVNESVKARTVQELIGMARAAPGKLSFASGGNGTSPHLAGELFSSMTGVKLLHVPYKGSPPSVLDLVAGRVDMIFANPSTVLTHIRSGKLRTLAVTSLQRWPALPDLPTISESGVPDFSVDVGVGVLAPAGTPAAVVDRLNQDIRAVMAREDVARQLTALDFSIRTGTAQEFGAYLRDELAKWTRLAKSAGIRIE